MEELLKLLVPAIFLIVWALSQLFNREAAPPPRPRGGMGGGGGFPPRPQPGNREGAGAAGALRPAAPPWLEREGPDRPVGIPSERRRAEPSEIVILEAEPRSPGPPRQRPASRGPARPRPGPRRSARAPARSEPGPPEPGGPGQAGAGHAAAFRPLDSPLTISSAQGAALVPVRETAPDDSSAAARVRATLLTPSRVREALILNELLRPPVALRHRTRQH